MILDIVVDVLVSIFVSAGICGALLEIATFKLLDFIGSVGVISASFCAVLLPVVGMAARFFFASGERVKRFFCMDKSSMIKSTKKKKEFIVCKVLLETIASICFFFNL